MDPQTVPIAWRETWDERAAMCEYDGGMDREAAEQFALQLLHASLVLLARDRAQQTPRSA
jgi:hypothetical protein